MSQSNPTVEEANAYAVEFIKNGVKQKAFRAAFPNSTCSDGTADTKGCKLFKNEQIQARIVQIQAASNQDTEEEFCVTVRDLKERLLGIADLGIAGKVDSEGNSSPANLSASVSAIVELNKMDGNHQPVKTQITGGLNITKKIIRVRTKKPDKPE